MRIEILVDGQDPQIFPLNKPKVLIGSQESCDIILQASGISRKQLLILHEDDSYFVIDQGSTNGSYINEERLVPGRKTEFTSFFPLRLGDNVLVSLLSDEDADDMGFSDLTEQSFKKDRGSENFNEATRTISLKDLQTVKTETLVKKRQETVIKRKNQTKLQPTPIKNDKKRMLWVQIFCISILAAAGYYNFFVAVPEVRPEPPKVVKMNRILPPEKVSVYSVVDPVDFTAKSKFLEIAKSGSCENDLEKYFCEKIGNGVTAVQVGTKMHLFGIGNVQLAKSKAFVHAPVPFDNGDIAPAKIDIYEKDLLMVTMMLFIWEILPKDFDFEKIKDLNIIIALEIDPTPETKDYVSMAITSASLKKLIESLQEKHIGYLEKYGAESFYFLKEMYRMDYKPLGIPPISTESLGTQSTPISESPKD